MNQPIKHLLIISSVLAATLLYALYQKTLISPPQESAKSNMLMVQRLPSFQLELIVEDGDKKNNGEKLTGEKLQKEGIRSLVVHFWGSWCPPCLPEIPELLEFARSLSSTPHLRFLLIAVRDKRVQVARFLKKFPNLPSNVSIALDPQGEIMTSFGTVKVPETHYYLQERSVKRFIGPQKWQNAYFLQELKKIL